MGLLLFVVGSIASLILLGVGWGFLALAVSICVGALVGLWLGHRDLDGVVRGESRCLACRRARRWSRSAR
jgi:hypothetical protein